MKTYKGNLPEYTIKKNKTNLPKVHIGGSVDAATYIRDNFFGDDLEIYESFFILFLNRANNTVAYAKISQGGTVGTVVDKKLIGKYALDSLAQACLICHNHPSGNKKPSQADIRVTKEVNDLLKILDVQLLDHLILTSESYFSFKDEGLI